MKEHEILATIKETIERTCLDEPGKMEKPFDNKNFFVWRRVSDLESIIINSKAIIHHKPECEVAIYGLDEIDMPLKDGFKTAGGYYSMLFHELGHWTAERVDRYIEHSKDGYAYEELVADMISWMLCLEYDLDVDERFYTINLQYYAGAMARSDIAKFWFVIEMVYDDALKAVKYLKKFI